MVNYVNTVLVSNAHVAPVSAISTSNAGKFVIINAEDGSIIDNTTKAANANAIKIGQITNKNCKDLDGNNAPIVKWSNVIKRDQIRHIESNIYNSSTQATSEDVVTIDFTNADITDLKKGKRIVVRIVYKDMPTRYRKWTDSFEYITKANDTLATIVSGLVAVINGSGSHLKHANRARVIASAGGTGDKSLILTADKYNDDDSVDTINVANKIRFNATIYMTDPSKTDFEFKNKYSINGVTVEKNPGKTYVGDGKLVRDREAEAMGYLGILNRGEGTWPIIKPAMNTNIDAIYNYYIIMFETMYRAADDIQRHTKECVEIYDLIKDSDNELPIKSILDAWVAGKEVNKDNLDALISDHNEANGVTETPGE